MQPGVIAIGLSVLCLVASFVAPLPPWINLVGIGLGLVGLVLLTLGRKKNGGRDA